MSAREHLNKAQALIERGERAKTAETDLAEKPVETYIQAAAEGIASIASSLILISNILANRLKK